MTIQCDTLKQEKRAMRKPLRSGGTFDAPETPNNLLRVAIYPRKSNNVEEGKGKSIREQVEFCRQVCDYYKFDPENTTLYEEAEGQKGEWYWRDPEGRNPQPWRPALTRLMDDIT